VTYVIGVRSAVGEANAPFHDVRFEDILSIIQRLLKAKRFGSIGLEEIETLKNLEL